MTSFRQVRRRLTSLSRQQRLTDDSSPVSSVFWTAYTVPGGHLRQHVAAGHSIEEFATLFGPDCPLDRPYTEAPAQAQLLLLAEGDRQGSGLDPRRGAHA